MMLHIEHCHCQFDRLSILSQLLLYLSITNALPCHFCSHYPLKFKCHQMGHSVMSSGEQTCDVFSSLSVTLHLSHLGSAQVQLKKEGNRKSILFLQTNIHICTIITWLQLAGKHLQSLTHPHHLSACPALVWAAEQGSCYSSWSRGGAASPGEQMGEAAGLGGAASPDPNSTLLLAAISRREPIIWDLLNIFMSFAVISPLWSLQNLA